MLIALAGSYKRFLGLATNSLNDFCFFYSCYFFGVDTGSRVIRSLGELLSCLAWHLADFSLF